LLNLNVHKYPKFLLRCPSLIKIAWWIRFLIEPRTRLLYKVAVNSKSKKILDLGSGDGMYASKLMGRNIQYTGVDRANENLGFCKKLLPEFNWILSDIESLNIDVSEYDEIWCFSVLPYLNDPTTFLEELHLKLKKGTVLKIYAPSHHYMELAIYKFLFKNKENYESLNSRKSLITINSLNSSLNKFKLITCKKLYGRNGRLSHELFSISLILFSQSNLLLTILGIITFALTLPFIIILGMLDYPKSKTNGLYTEWVRL